MCETLVMAHPPWCAITNLTHTRRHTPTRHSNGALLMWCAISKNIAMAHLILVRHCYIAVAHHIHGAPLMSILAIAVFLVVTTPT